MRTIDNFPLVSIIVPIYNVELYVKECILSVFAQDYQNIELIAVDDCGTDNSIAILEELLKVIPKIYHVYYYIMIKTGVYRLPEILVQSILMVNISCIWIVMMHCNLLPFLIW